ncbi:MAG: hypothetical protein BGO70_03335 [Bacteroidetes bacterium 43-93]|nr:DUF542 domain-containing protein [Bacteroidota bacterium]OJW98932.1 MAG: hypothetical protein BGO70_03335 [Bacteroidetes bacterium 43-93]
MDIGYCTISDVVVADYRTAVIFRKCNINFSCDGNRLVKEVCDERLQKELSLIFECSFSKDTLASDYVVWPLDVLVQHIRKRYHSSILTRIPILASYVEKVFEINGAYNSGRIRRLFECLTDSLRACLKYEESGLFPYIVAMCDQEKRVGLVNQAFACYGEKITSKITWKHRFCIECFNKIGKLSKDSLVSEHDNLYHLTCALLEVFEEEVTFCIHLENNILFPRSIELEAMLW